MQFNVAQLLKEPTGGKRRYTVNENLDDLDPDLVIQEPIRGEVKFTKIPQGILVTGRFQTIVEVTCTRCLDPFDLPLTFEVEEQFRPTIDLHTGATLPYGEDEDEATQISEKHIIDLSEVVRQDLLLTLPNTLLCREDCQGLCPSCGANWNDGRCACPTETLDPRWEALRGLLDGSDDEPMSLN